jgi:micrococcal nuclease
VQRLLALLACFVLACGSDAQVKSPSSSSAQENEKVPQTERTTAQKNRARDTGKSSSRRGIPRQSRRRDHRRQGVRQRNRVLVTRVVDGDTIEVQRGGMIDVRLIGIDTPESVHPSEPVECHGRAAAELTKRSLEGDMVRLELDVERRDRYGRTLAYVWDDARLFNQVLVERGFATVSTYPPNVKYVERFIAAQRRARNADRGLWGACARSEHRGALEDARGSGAGTPAGRESRGGDCDASYKGACIPSYPPDLDCTDVPQSFRSAGGDPHGFDGDGDGVACE